ncbi:Hachiman antiphage defense system protein HamA [Mycoplasma yeatsii]|uniref:Hachiman antiphage defense system protein HamA n=1 Tax=Mycoplasma yeatsii TaxID=51365 RepID=UPI0005B244E8|nr:Hachiman antiphage defense system protein HamA [Mycoplasma yeatsii]AJM72062.1 hypothetical protein MYE_03070 [Mycoplasma yeatsii GM274B]
MKKDSFQDFEVHIVEDRYCFLHINFNDEKKFLLDFASYIFDEDNLYIYSKNFIEVDWIPDDNTYEILYNNIKFFLDEELIDIDNTKKIDENKIPRNDKIGKLGEYILHITLMKYFKYSCVIPKFTNITSHNKSANGSDTLFFDAIKNEIVFGESKLTNDINSGIRKANKSLNNYPKLVKNEYKYFIKRIVADYSMNLNRIFLSNFGKNINEFDEIKDFLEHTNTKLVIPVSIVHGNGKKTSAEEFINELNKIKRKSINKSIDAKFLLLSFPIIDKNKFLKIAFEVAVQKYEEYKNKKRSRN